MTRSLTVLFSFFMVFSLTLGPTRSAADPLPMRLTVDLSGIANYGDHPDPSGLEAAVVKVLSDHVADVLFLHWFVTQSASNAEMALKVTQATARRKLNITLEFRGDEFRQVKFRGASPDSVPRNGENFSDDLIEALYEFLFEKSAEIEGASAFVHTETDDALYTLLQLDRPLGEDIRLRYRPEKLDIKWDLIPRYVTYEGANADSFQIPVLLVPGATRSGVLRPQIYQSHEGDLPRARFCVHRPMIANPPAGQQPAVSVVCPIEGECSVQGAQPTGWADDNCQIPVNFHAPAMWRQSWGAAFARVLDVDRWTVPTLDVLFDRVENHPGRFVGFTEFTLRARELQGLDADAFSARVFANGVPILINGLSADERIRPFDPARGLLFRFGLENLKFAGREDGCEDLAVVLQFYRHGEKLEQDIVLRRGYASLRHAPERVLETPYGTIKWSGEYIAPGSRNENGIFLASALFVVGVNTSEKNALARLNTLRAQLDGFGWSIKASELGLGLGLESVLTADDDLAIVGKIRPPLTIRDDGSAAYGLLVGVEEPSGQLQFTFDSPQRRALLRFLARQRAENATARSLVPETPFVYAYSEERREGPDWVCRDR